MTDSRGLVGVEDPLEAEERLCNLIADAIAPRLVPNIELLTADGKTLLVAEVFPGSSRPYYLRKEGPDHGVYVRLGSSNRRADGSLIADLRRSVEGVAFEEMPMPDLGLEDLDLKAAADSFGSERKLDQKTLLTLRLLRKEQGRLVPTKGAVLLFGRERLAHFPDAWIQCGRFSGTSKSEVFDHIEFYDPLPKAVESILLFLKKHAYRGADLSRIRRKDVWSIPLSILREVVINALVHADYSQRGGPLRVAFFDDRIEVENPGILLPGMTIEDMKQGVSKVRNPVIARVFRELGLIEQWGSGVRRIFEQARAAKLSDPRIVELGMRLRFVVPLASAMPAAVPPVGEQVKDLALRQKGSEENKKGSEESNRSSEENKKGSEQSTKSSEEILKMLQEEPKLTARAIAKRLKLTSRAVEKQIARLRQSNRLRRHGPAKGGYWEVTGWQ